MIFNRLFKKNAWEHKNNTVRITAIQNELSIDKSEQLEILNTMLNSDECELVRRAVLHKINKFDVWVSASVENSNANVKQFALSTVEDIVLGNHEIKPTDQQKIELLHCCKGYLLEAWLKKETSPKLALEIFEKIQKPQLLIPTVIAQTEPSVQLALLSTVSDVSVLEKLLKKVKNVEIQDELNAKITILKEQQEKPKQLLKQSQLVLAKFLAIKDLTDYEKVVHKSELLENEWQELLLQFSILRDDIQQELIAKLAEIKGQLQKLFASKAEAYEQKKIADELASEKKRDSTEVIKRLTTFDEELSNAIFQNIDIDELAFSENLDKLRHFVSETSLNEREKNAYLKKVDVLRSKLSHLPEMAESVTKATHLISKISQASLPKELADIDEKEESYKAWLNNWKKVSDKANGVLPQSLMSSYQQIVSSWDSSLKPLREQQKKNFFQTQRKLRDVARLVEQGKFNAAFGVFKKAGQGYALLSKLQRAKLERDYNKTKESIDNLSDWENYIATPKKQQLLQEMTALAKTPHDNPSQQANAVKEYRSRWNSLGHADESVDRELNSQFNEVCEKAFAPCRLFYAEQEKLRALHLSNRNTLIEETKNFVRSIDNDNCEWKSVSNKINLLRQQWRESGEVERSVFRRLNQEFTQLLKPLEEGVKRYNLSNITKKESLIKLAQELTEIEDIFKAVDETKSLQAKWKTIGYCGAREENRLWKQFRQLNDLVFDKRTAQQENEKNRQSALVEQYHSELKQIVEEVSKCTVLSEIKVFKGKLSSLLSVVKQTGSNEKVLSNNIEKAQKEIINKINAIKNESTKKLWQAMFEVLEYSLNGEAIDCTAFESLPTYIRKKIIANIGDASNDARKERTIELEILASKDSPEEDKEKRLAIQVNLMQQQIESGQTIDVEDKFWQWLLLGRLTSSDAVLLERAKQIMLVN